ncbi:MAG: hypothetical protein B7Z73_06210 [Planctomycetia bacterium 21-64-5]|nr:MAG: hypothetical protein B7Z73_06210 [Planctomycetia bacterium 21-64-5]HQU42033.1 hypothetical protein [Pirellulales bacterium]
MYDLPIGRTNDTVATCQIDLNDLFGFLPDQLRAMKNLAASRMGIYEHMGISGRFVRRSELGTNKEFVCLSTTGYPGHPGELWYVHTRFENHLAARLTGAAHPPPSGLHASISPLGFSSASRF